MLGPVLWKAGVAPRHSDGGPGPFLIELALAQVCRAWAKAEFVFAAFPEPAEVWGEHPNTHSIQHSLPPVTPQSPPRQAAGG